MLVLEEYEHARRRGARIYGEVAGYATRCNAYHMTGLKTDGIEMAEAVRHALDEARANPTDVDYTTAHGSGTTQNDRHETAAFKRSLGSTRTRTPVSGIKSMIGHSLRRHRRHRDRRLRPRPGQRRRTADGQPPRTGSRMRPGLRAADGA